MKLTYLGTAAAEGFPALFCNCKYCNEARRLGGKNIRTRSQSLINEDMLIDFPADSYMHFLNGGIEGDKIKHLLITHTHSDHFYPKDLFMRHTYFAHDMRVPTLNVFCSEAVRKKFDGTPTNVEITVLRPYETADLGDYRVTALPARHMREGGCLIYIIEGEKTLLYAHDTGYFYDEVFDFIKEKGIKLDMATFDCTNVNIPISDSDGHMGFANIERVINRLTEIGAITEATVKYVNHFSHNGNPVHDYLEENAEKIGCKVSYDGCKVEF